MFVRTATASTTAAALLGAGALLLPADRPEAPDQVSAQRANPVVVAHRGASGYAPENTLAAVDAADALGIDWVENDVHRSRDGVLVVLHDTDLKRTTDVEEVFPDRAPWAVKDFTAAELAKLDAGSWFEGAVHRGPDPDAHPVPAPPGAQPAEAAPGDQEPGDLPGHRAGHHPDAGPVGVAGPLPRTGTGWSSRASAPTA